MFYCRDPGCNISGLTYTGTFIALYCTRVNRTMERPRQKNITS
jgi:hypothetical protein